jgi:hypothetical protein
MRNGTDLRHLCSCSCPPKLNEFTAGKFDPHGSNESTLIALARTCSLAIAKEPTIYEFQP